MISTRVGRDVAQEIGRHCGCSISRLTICKLGIEEPRIDQDDLIQRCAPDGIHAGVGAVSALEAKGSGEVDLGEDGVVESIQESGDQFGSACCSAVISLRDETRRQCIWKTDSL